MLWQIIRMEKKRWTDVKVKNENMKECEKQSVKQSLVAYNMFKLWSMIYIVKLFLSFISWIMKKN